MVTQFHFLSWPEKGSPNSGAGMIDLIDQVRRVQQKTGNNPIVVHCRRVIFSVALCRITGDSSLPFVTAVMVQVAQVLSYH